MLSGHLQGRILLLSSAIKPKNILEIGTYTYVFVHGRRVIQSGKLVTIDKNIELETMVKKYINNSPYKHQIEFINSDAVEAIPALNLKWDLVFIDADKENYITYFDLVIDQVNKGGWIIADNVLWSGKVLDEPDIKDKETVILKKFNEKVHRDSRVRNVLFPVRDGMMIMIKN